jgi:hypothetical protein
LVCGLAPSSYTSFVQIWQMKIVLHRHWNFKFDVY